MRQAKIAIPGYVSLPFSQAVRAGDFLFISGQTAFNPDSGRVEVDGFSGQLVAVLDRIAGMLKECDGDLRDVVKTNAYLKNSTDFGEFNKIYRTYFREGPPARTTIVAEFCADVLVEIEVIAYLPNN